MTEQRSDLLRCECLLILTVSNRSQQGKNKDSSLVNAPTHSSTAPLSMSAYSSLGTPCRFPHHYLRTWKLPVPQPDSFGHDTFLNHSLSTLELPGLFHYSLPLPSRVHCFTLVFLQSRNCSYHTTKNNVFFKLPVATTGLLNLSSWSSLSLLEN